MNNNMKIVVGGVVAAVLLIVVIAMTYPLVHSMFAGTMTFHSLKLPRSKVAAKPVI